MVALLCIAFTAAGLSNAVSVGAKTVAATEGSSSKLINPAQEGNGCGCLVLLTAHVAQAL